MTQPSEAAPCRFCGKPACEGDCINLARPFPDDLGADDGGDGVPVHSSLPPAELSRLQHSLSLAVEALGPFAKIADDLAMLPDDHEVVCDASWAIASGTDGVMWDQTVRDFRRAAEALSKLTGGG